MKNEPTVLLAALVTGEHVQVGRVREHDAAYALFERMDSQVSGFVRERGALRFRPEHQRKHFIDGTPVSFYRLRQQGHEFGNVRTFPVSAVRLSNRPRKDTISMTSRKTASGIVRPKTGGFASWDYARGVAKRANAAGVGRGHRAIKAQNGSYTVIFRPAVVNNKQRKVRSI